MFRYFAWMISVFSIALSGCEILEEGLSTVSIRGSGKVVEEKRDVSGFHEVALNGMGNLSIEQGTQEALTVETDDNILPKIRTDVEGGRLSIGVERGVSIHPSGTIRYKLTLRDLTRLDLAGSGKINAGPLRCKDLAVRLPGSGDIRIDQLTAESVRAEINGSGRIEIPGKVPRQRVQIAGSGDYDARNLDSQEAEVSISGSGDATIWVRESLSAHISGSGRVDYYGNPTVTKSISGSGNIRNIGATP